MGKEQIQKEKVQALYGINKELETNPDLENSVKCHNGTFVPKMNGSVRIFRGIPFAMPPIKERRWKKPEPIPESDKIFEAYYNGKSPIQTVIDSERSSYYPQGEDCLYLNIWTNNSDNSKNKPIMVFIHGGSYGWGGTVDPLYDGYNFITLHPDVILITIAYRIGILGFIDLSYLKGGENYPDAPNLGILDQIEALRWIQKNGEAFGGDINNVTIFGESAGGGSVSLLPIIKEAKGLFKRVIAESGSVALTYAKEECKILTEMLKKAAKTDSIEEIMQFSEEQIMEINKGLNDSNNFPMRDGKLIPLDPYEPYLNGETKDIDMMFGTNANEMNYWIGELGGVYNYCFGMPIKYKYDLKKLNEDDQKRVNEIFEKLGTNEIWRISEFYNETMFRLPAIRQAEGHSKNGGNIYLYYWKEESKIPYFKACHAVELAYVFYNIDDTIYTGEPADKELAKDISTMWVNFAKCGNPSIDTISWPKYDEVDRKTLVIKKGEVSVVSDILKEQREALSPLLGYMINPGYGNLDMSMSPLTKVKALAEALNNSLLIKTKG